MADALVWIYVLAFLGAALVAFHDAPLRWLAARREGRVRQDVLYHVVNTVSILIAVAWLAALATGVDRRVPGPAGPGEPLGWLGLGLGLSGIGLALWARFAMGSAFAPTASLPPDERVVEEGPFGHVRHPFYAGMMIALAGGVLVLDSLVTLACLLALLPLVEILARREEVHLEQALGQTYRDYRERVPRWLPRP